MAQIDRTKAFFTPRIEHHHPFVSTKTDNPTRNPSPKDELATTIIGSEQSIKSHILTTLAYCRAH
jgi:hypothetical protein